MRDAGARYPRLVALAFAGALLGHGSSAPAQAPQSALPASQPAINAVEAVAVFAEAHALCSADDGRLWGVSLCGRMMFVDPRTHQAVANQMAAGAVKDGSIYRFALSSNAGVANTSLEYDGARWTMIMWPLPVDDDVRAVMLMHESYHRIQPQLGLQGSGAMGTNGHLDAEQGRVWLRGELHALKAALQATGQARADALRDALTMREYRRSLFAAAASEEAGLEINEGLAESTGIDVGLPAERRTDYALRDIALVESAPSYVRTFTFGTGPGYVELLDAIRADWRRTVSNSSDLGTLAAGAYGLTVPVPSAAEAARVIARYAGAQIQTEERSRAAAAGARADRYTKEFVDGPTLTLPLKHMHITFNSNAVEEFTGHGSVFHTMHLTDDWGTLDVTGADVLISPSFDLVTLQAPATHAGPTITGSRWVLQLAPGYSAAPDPNRPTSLRVMKGT